MTAYHPKSTSVEWGTPLSLFESLDAEFRFGADMCASESNALCEIFVDKEEDCLSFEWEWAADLPHSFALWMNPPWGRKIGRFIQKAYEQSKKQRAVVVCLLPANTDTKWWRDWVWKASEVRLITGRLRFECSDGRTGPCPTGACVVVFTPWGEGPPKVSLMSRGT
jgi:site-specific DNA-methyltransferase (adenine-specific)